MDLMIVLQLVLFGLSNGAIIALNALGVTLVYSVVRTVNFAYGDLFALCTVLTTQMVLALGLQAGGPLPATAGGMLAALLASMLFGALANWGVERIAFRPFRGRSQLAPLIAGIGLSFVLFQAAITWRVAAEVGFGNPEHHSDIDNLANVPHFGIPQLLPDLNLATLAGLPIRYTLTDLLLLALALILALGVAWFLAATRAGRALRACAQDPEMAQLCGIDHNRAIGGVFALGGALAGAAAFIFTIAYQRPFGQHGAESGLLAFTAAVLGGIGNPLGALLAGIVLGVASSFSDFLLPAQWTPVVVLALLIALLTLRPTGLAAEAPARSSDLVQPAAEGVRHQSRAHSRRWALLALALLALAYPLLDQLLGLQRQAIINNMLIFALLALGLNIVLGMAGILDLGYAACFAVGGYTAALLVGSPLGAQLDFIVVLAAAMLAAALFGALNGLLTLRLRGDYLAVVALAFGQLVPRVVVNLSAWTGGAGGMAALPPPRIAGFALATQSQRYYLALALVALGLLISRRLGSSRIGRAWAALSADETAATSSGVSLARLKPLAFIVGASLAGAAAALSATIFGYVDPDQSDFRISAMTLAMVVVGGAGSPRGAITGALIIAGYDQILLPALGAWWVQVFGDQAPIQLAELNYLAFGLALYLTVLWRGRGLR
jgi:branched-chain amino acid transport system permease protein